MLAKIWRTYSDFISEEIVPYLGRKDKKNLYRQCRELISLYLKYRQLPYQYFRSNLYMKARVEDPLDFMPPPILRKVQKTLNPADKLYIADNKMEFERVMRTSDVPTAGCLFWTTAQGEIYDLDDRLLSIPEAVEIARTVGGTVFAKPLSGSLGLGTHKVDLTSGSFEPKGFFIYQKWITQLPQITECYPHAVNTIRIPTVMIDGVARHTGAFLRLGVDNAFVDNASAGGIVIGINLETGKLYKNAYRLSKFGGGPITAHPDTGFVFEGYQVPQWDEILDVTLKAAQAILPLGTLGWDVAMTPEGPLVVEANPGWAFSGMQLSYGGLLNTPIGQYAMKIR